MCIVFFKYKFILLTILETAVPNIEVTHHTNATADIELPSWASNFLLKKLIMKLPSLEVDKNWNVLSKFRVES